MKVEAEEGVMNLNFSPSEHKTAESAAKALYEALLPLVKATGQDPAWELSIHPPKETPEYLPGHKHWWVNWEAGPYDWGIIASYEIHGDNWFTEPYYGFDLLFIQE